MINGMLGKKHTPEAKKKQGDASRAHWRLLRKLKAEYVERQAAEARAHAVSDEAQRDEAAA